MQRLPNRRSAETTPAILAMLPTMSIVVFVYCFGIGWSAWASFTSSKLLPKNDFVGLLQYERLFGTNLWERALQNLVLFAALFIAGSLLIGYILAICLSQRIRFEGVFRTIILLPSALSLVVTALVWRWIFDPTLGLQRDMRGLGWENFELTWLVESETAIFALIVAAIWHMAGLIMVILLAGLRGVNEDIWQASLMDGVPLWRMYFQIIPGVIWPSFATATMILLFTSFKTYELVVVMTNGGPGNATEMPTLFIMDMLFQRSNIGQAAAASMTLLALVTIAASPWWISRLRQAFRSGRHHG